MGGKISALEKVHFLFFSEQYLEYVNSFTLIRVKVDDVFQRHTHTLGKDRETLDHHHHLEAKNRMSFIQKNFQISIQFKCLKRLALK